jgi:hypothetical protein
MSLFAINTSVGPVFINPAHVISIYIVIGGRTVVLTNDASHDGYYTHDPLESVVNRFQSAVGSSRTYVNMISRLEKESK